MKTGQLLNVVHVNVNVTDLERSVEFYERFGFEVMHVFTNDPEQAGEYTGPNSRGTVMSISDDPRASCKIELIEWLNPPALPQPERPEHQAGVGRIAIRTKNLLAHVEMLSKAGIEPALPVQEIDLVGVQRYVVYHDPDGVLLELAEF
jgi:catechol 2,3-dioxygenase-like lactoylglutathione lyase family enzyme